MGGKAPITEDMLRERLLKFGNGIEYVSGLISTHHKAVFRCHCGKLFETTPKTAVKCVGCKSCACKIAQKNRRPKVSKFVQRLRSLYGESIELVGEYKTLTQSIEFMCSDGHHFCVRPQSILRGRGCPVCNSIKNRKSQEEFESELHTLCGDRFDEIGKYVSSTVKVHLHCTVCDHRFYILPSNILKRGGCPYCSGIAHKTTLEFEDQIHAVCGEEFSCVSEYINSQTSVDIACGICGSVFSVLPSNFLRGQGCPVCRNSKYESPMISVLDSLGIFYLYNKGIEGCVSPETGRCLRFDFIIPDSKVLIELDGSQHFIELHKETRSSLSSIQIRDRAKDIWAMDHGWILLRASDSPFRTEFHIPFSDLIELLKKNCSAGSLVREGLLQFDYNSKTINF